MFIKDRTTFSLLNSLTIFFFKIFISRLLSKLYSEAQINCNQLLGLVSPLFPGLKCTNYTSKCSASKDEAVGTGKLKIGPAI